LNIDTEHAPPLALMPEQQFTMQETAQILRVSTVTIRRLAQRGELKAIGKGRLVRFALKDIRAYQDRNRQ
jgi:excisionase family DNA binding protein